MKIHTFTLARVFRSINAIPALLLFLACLASGNSYAASCQNMLQGHLDWVSQTPNGYSRSVAVTMVSNYADRFVSNNMSQPEATYFTAGVNKGSWIFQNSLVGSGYALFNNRTWSQPNSFATHPFDPNDTDKWSVFLNPANSSMSLVRDGSTLNIPLDCTGNLASGVYSKYVQYGSFKLYVGDYRYVVSLTRNQYQSQLPK